MFEELTKESGWGGWANSDIFYPDGTPNASGYVNAAGDAFNASAEMQKLHDNCYHSYPDGLIKGYHKGRAKAFNKCIAAANDTVSTLAKEYTKVQGDSQFGATVTSALGTSAPPDNTNMIIGVAVLLLIAGGAYYFTRPKAAVAAGPPAPPAK